MKMKRLVAVLLVVCVCFGTMCYASDSDMEARLAALEARVAALEALLGIDGTSAQELSTETQETPVATEEVSLGSGTWIVGQDIAPGKYNLVSHDGIPEIDIYGSFEDKESDSHKIEGHTMLSEEYLAMAMESAGETDDSLYRSLYEMEISNVTINEGYCIYIQNGSVTFTPAQ